MTSNGNSNFRFNYSFRLRASLRETPLLAFPDRHLNLLDKFHVFDSGAGTLDAELSFQKTAYRRKRPAPGSAAPEAESSAGELRAAFGLGNGLARRFDGMSVLHDLAV